MCHPKEQDASSLIMKLLVPLHQGSNNLSLKPEQRVCWYNQCSIIKRLSCWTFCLLAMGKEDCSYAQHQSVVNLFSHKSWSCFLMHLSLLRLEGKETTHVYTHTLHINHLWKHYQPKKVLENTDHKSFQSHIFWRRLACCKHFTLQDNDTTS